MSKRTLHWAFVTLSLLILIPGFCFVIQNDSKFDNIEQQLDKNPNKARQMLRDIHFFASKRQKGFHALLTLLTTPMNRMRENDDSLIYVAYNVYSLNHNPQNFAWTLFYCGEYYRQVLHSHHNAKEFYNQALQEARNADDRALLNRMQRQVSIAQKACDADSTSAEKKIELLKKEQQFTLQLYRRDVILESYGKAAKGFLVILAILSVIWAGKGIYIRIDREHRLQILKKERQIADGLHHIELQKALLEQQSSNLLRMEDLLSRTDGDKVGMEEQIRTLHNEHLRLKEQLLRTDEVVRKVEHLKDMTPKQKHGKNGTLVLSESEVGTFISVINDCYDGIIDYLRKTYTKLSDADLYLCALLLLGASNADIAMLISTSEDTLKKRKYRIKREKMQLSSSDLPLEDLLHEMAKKRMFKN